MERSPGCERVGLSVCQRAETSCRDNEAHGVENGVIVSKELTISRLSVTSSLILLKKKKNSLSIYIYTVYMKFILKKYKVDIKKIYKKKISIYKVDMKNNKVYIKKML